MANELVDILQAASREFQQFVEKASKTASNAAAIPVAVANLKRLDFCLKHVSKCLAAAPRPLEKDSIAARQVLTYRENLRVLKASVETLQSNLLAEKTRLENAQGNMKAVRAWAESVRETS